MYVFIYYYLFIYLYFEMCLMVIKITFEKVIKGFLNTKNVFVLLTKMLTIFNSSSLVLFLSFF